MLLAKDHGLVTTEYARRDFPGSPVIHVSEDE